MGCRGSQATGDATVFARADAVDAAWSIVEPILGEGAPVHTYAPGTWGPQEAERLTRTIGGWRTPMGTPGARNGESDGR